MINRFYSQFTLVGALVAAMASGPVLAATVTVQSGPVTIISSNLTTAGTLANPWLITESITAVSPPSVLRFDVGSSGDLNPLGLPSQVSPFIYGRYFSKTVTNNSNSAWSSFDLELQTVLGVPSTDGDGLSFAQGAGIAVSASPQFTVVNRIDDVRDFLNFSGGTGVAIGQSVTFTFQITDNTNRNTFYLSETPNRLVTGIPEPETYAMMLAGLGMLGFMVRRRKQPV